MPANPNWARWTFSSVAHHLKTVATQAGLAVLVDHLDDRTTAFQQATDRVEIRITGPFTKECSANYYQILIDANVLILSRYDTPNKNGLDILTYEGLFNEAMDSPIPVWNYGQELTDYNPDDPDSQIFLGCLLPKSGKDNSAVRVFNFGQADKVEKIKCSVVDARYEMYIDWNAVAR
ncbi:MAG TPA: hypothetical protein VHD36_12445 [Pirellulales bacterium]|nr:hypothetical protein [Pirellulales bacterium]